MLKDDGDDTGTNAASYGVPMSTLQPGHHDLLLGRGGETNNHSGNVIFRRLVDEYKSEYQDAPKGDKPEIARRLVAHWRRLDPPGRFLSKKEGSELWVDVGDQAARRRASKSLGERAKPPFVIRTIEGVASHPSESTGTTATSSAAHSANAAAAIHHSHSLEHISGNKRQRSDNHSTMESPLAQPPRMSLTSTTQSPAGSNLNSNISRSLMTNVPTGTTTFFDSLSQLFNDQSAVPPSSSTNAPSVFTRGHTNDFNTGTGSTTMVGGDHQEGAAAASTHTAIGSNQNPYFSHQIAQHRQEQQISPRYIAASNPSQQQLANFAGLLFGSGSSPVGGGGMSATNPLSLQLVNDKTGLPHLAAHQQQHHSHAEPSAEAAQMLTSIHPPPGSLGELQSQSLGVNTNDDDGGGVTRSGNTMEGTAIPTAAELASIFSDEDCSDGK